MRRERVKVYGAPAWLEKAIERRAVRVAEARRALDDEVAAYEHLMKQRSGFVARALRKLGDGEEVRK